MDIQLGIYRNNIQLINTMLVLNDNLLDNNILSLMSIATGCPLIAVCYFLKEIVGETEFLNERIERFKKFYDYGEIYE